MKGLELTGSQHLKHLLTNNTRSTTYGVLFIFLNSKFIVNQRPPRVIEKKRENNNIIQRTITIIL
jgi:hypothetical protein